jgi:type IV pilus assembly protein PilB
MEKSELYPIVVDNCLVSQKEIEALISFPDYELFVLLRNNFHLNEDKLLRLIADKKEILYEKIENLVVDPNVSLDKKYEDYLQEGIIPIYDDNNEVCIAVNNPFLNKIHDFRNSNLKGTKIVLLNSNDFNVFFGSKVKEYPSFTLFDQLIIQGIEKKASDIHVNTIKDGLTIAYRIDGELYDISEFSGKSQKQLIALLKLHSHMDIACSSKPQDGRLSFSYKKKQYDIRVSSLPTVFGEDFVLRLFNSSTLNFDINSLGLSTGRQEIIQEILNNEAGLVLVTGPTGSGKTTTLYSFINYLLHKKKPNIITLEDPVETVLPGIRQSQINVRIGYDFVAALKAILRQDPDVIMIGEIRDEQTAKIALQAAYTGHLVLATLHTYDCESTLFRLLGYSLDPFMVMQSLRAIISQKLTKKMCESCRKVDMSTDSNVYCACGCVTCSYTGKNGRVLLSEILKIDKADFSQDFVKDTKKLLDKNSFYSFEEDIAEKVKIGII